MQEQTPQALRADLEHTKKELDLVLAIDHIRDSASEPAAMLVAIADTLTDFFQADLCLICLRDRETGELELKAVSDRSQRFGQLGITRELAERILQTSDVVVWEGDKVRSVLGLPSEQPSPPDILQLAAIPIIMGADELLGAMLLIRSRSPFDAHDIALLKTAESQLDSTVIQGYSHHDLQQRNRELETIYHVDRIRDRQLAFDEMLHAVLQEVCAVIQAEMGFVMLYNRAGRQLELRATTNDDLFRVASHYTAVVRVANEALDKASLICNNDLGDELRSALSIPLILENEIIGVLGVVNAYRPRGFNDDDRRLLSAIGSQMDTAIFESLERRRLRQLLGRSVSPRVMEWLLENPDVEFLKGERTVLTVLYSDVRGSTSMAEHTGPELFVGFINDYLGRMTDIILSHEGTLDKFVGDEVMALFGAPYPQPDHALRAVRAGMDMQQAHQQVMKDWQARGVTPAPIGVGISTGELIVGEMGSSQRTDYTVIGRTANLGARLCSAARAGQVLISQETYDLVKAGVDATPITGLHLKGIDYDVIAYHVTRLL